MTTRDRFPALYSGPTPAWDIGRPQPELLVAFDKLALTGSVLDLGYGTGENTLELARRGLEAWGLDATPAALAIAEGRRESLFKRFSQRLRERVRAGSTHGVGGGARRGPRGAISVPPGAASTASGNI